jgi:hypothetical protein
MFYWFSKCPLLHYRIIHYICFVIHNIYITSTEALLPSLHLSMHLSIDVTERPGKGVASIADSDRGRTNKSSINSVIESSVAAGRSVVNRDGSTYGVLAVLDVQILPCPPGAVYHGVMEVESRVTGGSEEVTSGITTNGKMTTSVNTEEAVAEIALHASAEGSEVLVVFNEIGNVRVFSPALRCGGRNVTTQTAGVVSKPSELWIGGVVRKDRSYRAEVNFPAIYMSVIEIRWSERGQSIEAVRV